jgi:nucleotide-binding universal stress UspA family protein
MPGIIVGVDGSGHSHRALQWAVSEAAVRRAPLTVLTVHQPVAGSWGGTIPYPDDTEIIRKLGEEVQRETDDVLDGLDTTSGPLSVTIRAVTGLPAEQLLAAAADADMLVVGARGGSGFKRLLLGSVSTHVTHHATCPVVVIPAGADLAPGGDSKP